MQRIRQLWVTSVHAQPVGRIWATDNNWQACPLPLLTEEKTMTEDCILHSLVVWLHPSHFVPVTYRQVSGPTHRAGCWTSCSMWCSCLVHCGLCPPPWKQPLAAAQLCVGKHRKDVCTGGAEWSSQQEHLQPSVLNTTMLLPHQIYKTPNRLAPAVLSFCLSSLAAPHFVLSLSSAHLDTLLAIPVACNSPNSCAIYTEPSPEVQLRKHLSPLTLRGKLKFMLYWLRLGEREVVNR